MKRVLAFILAIGMVFSLSACCIKHEWKDATCTTPQVCAKCGKINGSALGHGDTKQVIGETDYVSATRAINGVCTVCGKVLATESETVSSFVADEVFTFNCKQYSERMEAVYTELALDVTMNFKYDTSGDYVMLIVLNQNDVELGGIVFYDNTSTAIAPGKAETTPIETVGLIVPEIDGLSKEAHAYLFRMLMNLVCMAVDPQLGDDAILSDIIADKYESTPCNSIYYEYFVNDSGSYVFYAETKPA